MTVCSTFDLDGVLIDSRHAVREAYLRGGIRMPPHAWGKPWREWLIDSCEGDEVEAKRVHDIKNEIYPEMIRRHARQLPLADYLGVLVEAHLPVHILTGASQDAAYSACRFLGIDPGLLYGFETTRRGKEHALQVIAAGHPIGVYFDDQYVTVPSGWQWVKVIPKEIKA